MQSSVLSFHYYFCEKLEIMAGCVIGDTDSIPSGDSQCWHLGLDSTSVRCQRPIPDREMRKVKHSKME